MVDMVLSEIINRGHICIIWADRTQFEHTGTLSRTFLCACRCYCACLSPFLCHMLLQPWACRWQSRRVHGCCNSSLAAVHCGRQWCPDSYFCKRGVEYDVLYILVGQFLHSGMEKWRRVDIWGVKLKKLLRSRCQSGHVPLPQQVLRSLPIQSLCYLSISDLLCVLTPDISFVLG